MSKIDKKIWLFMIGWLIVSICMGVLSLFLILVFIFNGIYFYEPNRIVLIIEIIMCISGIVIITAMFKEVTNGI